MRVWSFGLFVFIQIIITKQSGAALPQCANKTTLDPRFTVAYKGWPHHLQCNTLAISYNEEKGYEWEVYDLPYDDPIQCIITNATSVLDNITTSIDYLLYDYGDIGYVIGEINDNTTLSYSIILTTQNGSRCFSADIVLNVTSQNESSCNERRQEFGEPSHTIVGLTKKISCGLDINEYPKLVKDQMTYEWEYNCSPQLPEVAQLSENNETLEIKSFDFAYAGFYSCTALYKGKKRFVNAFYACAKNENDFTSNFLKCDRDTVSLNPGESGEVACTAIFGRGSLDLNIQAIVFKHEDKTTSKTIQCKKETNNPTHGDVRCILNHPINKCYLVPPSRRFRSSSIASVQIQIQFRNITEFDYGKYVIAVKSFQEGISPANFTILLEPNPKPFLLTQIEIAGISIGIVIIFIIIVLLLAYFSVYIRVHYKRYFGVFVIDNKKYGAVLAYNFSQDLDKFAQENIRSSVSKIREVLERKGFRTYEEGREGFAAGSRSETIEVSIERSHRVLIFLSLEFIKDGWSMLALQKGFNEMIHSRSKLIFILLPGIKEYLKQHSKYDDSCRLIQRAIKLNYAIQLPKDFNNRRFQYQLEDAMPKLPHRSPSQTSSLSSNFDITVPNYDQANFRRCFSNETDITDVESPGLAPNLSTLEMMSQLDEEPFDTAL